MTREQKDHDLKISEWADAYVSFRPLLFSALGRLARQGYPTEPSEAPEIIHDFLAEAWPGLTERFDPTRANFRTYLYGAFLRFARIRIVQRQRWHASLVSPEEMALIKGNESDDVEIRIDLAVVRQVLNRLPHESRRILETLTSAGYRERRAAARMGVSRHRFRCLAAEALAQFAIEMDISELVPESDWPLARGLWAEGRSLEDAAAAIGISVVRARIVRRKILRTLEDTLSEFSPSQASRKKEGTMTLCDLWQQFVLNPTDRKLAIQVRKRVDELFEHLQECEDCDAQSEALQSNLAAFYEAIGATLEITEVDDSALEEYERATAENNARVRDAIESVLLPALPPPLVMQLLARMRSEAPINMFLACEALAMRIHRHARHEGVCNFLLKRNGLYFASMEKAKQNDDFISRKILIDEICAFASIDEDTAGFLLDWVIAAARSFPNLMLGIEAAPKGTESITLKLRDRDPTVNLYEYWQPSPGLEVYKFKPSLIREAFKEMETEMITKALKAHDFNREATADALGMSRTNLIKKIKKYGIV